MCTLNAVLQLFHLISIFCNLHTQHVPLEVLKVSMQQSVRTQHPTFQRRGGGRVATLMSLFDLSLSLSFSASGLMRMVGVGPRQSLYLYHLLQRI
jgi:hypothetical protein